MAKRKAKKTTRRRSRRVGGIGTGLMPVLAVAAGAVGARLIAAKVVPASINPKISAAAQILVGMFLAKMANPLAKGLGLGMAANGGISLATSTGLISGLGIGAADVIPFRSLPQAREMSIVNGYGGMGNPQGSPAMNLINGIGIGNPQGSPGMATLQGSGALG